MKHGLIQEKHFSLECVANGWAGLQLKSFATKNNNNLLRIKVRKAFCQSKRQITLSSLTTLFIHLLHFSRQDTMFLMKAGKNNVGAPLKKMSAHFTFAQTILQRLALSSEQYQKCTYFS